MKGNLMKRSWMLLLVLLVALPATALAQLDSQVKKQSYALGVQLGSDLKRGEVDIDPEAVAQGISDVLDDRELKLSEQQIAETMQAMQTEMMEKQMALRQQQAGENLEKSQEFLAENKKKEDVKTTASGLQYMVIKEGTGKAPGPEDEVTVHYRGKLIDGTVFDSSYERGTPATFPVKGVIPGWTEGLQLMKEGGEYRLFVPAKLAYGERGAGEQIGPNQALIFDVELLSVKEAGKEVIQKK